MVVWKRTQKSTCCLLLARFLFVNLFIAVASLFTWRGRREGVSWVGEHISWKFGDFLSCIQYLCVHPTTIDVIKVYIYQLLPPCQIRELKILFEYECATQMYVLWSTFPFLPSLCGQLFTFASAWTSEISNINDQYQRALFFISKVYTVLEILGTVKP